MQILHSRIIGEGGPLLILHGYFGNGDNWKTIANKLKENFQIVFNMNKIVFGLVLHISNINEIEHFSAQKEQWKTIQNGGSIAFIAFYSILFAINLIGEKIVDVEAITKCAIGLSVVSFFISYSVYDKVSKASIPTGENVI